MDYLPLQPNSLLLQTEVAQNTEAQAYEIVESVWLKLAELSEVRATKEVDGYPMFDAMTQGVDINDPRISINELSEMLLSHHEPSAMQYQERKHQHAVFHKDVQQSVLHLELR